MIFFYQLYILINYILYHGNQNRTDLFNRLDQEQEL